jgi:hypothetical protein
MLLTVLTNFSGANVANPLVDIFPNLARLNVPQGHSSTLIVALISAFSVLPVLLAVWIVARYLKAEPDEFIRALAVRALLWGIAVTMAGDAIAGVVTVFYARPFPIGLLNADLFWVSTAIAFRLVLRSYR